MNEENRVDLVWVLQSIDKLIELDSTGELDYINRRILLRCIMLVVERMCYECPVDIATVIYIVNCAFYNIYLCSSEKNE